MPRRFQFSLKAFLAAILVVAAFFGGMVVQKALDLPLSRQVYARSVGQPEINFECIEMRDGTKWYRATDGELVITNGPADKELADKGISVVDYLRLPDGSHWRHVPEVRSAHK